MNIKYTEHLFRTKGILGTCCRFGKIVKRFGITSKKIENCLDSFISITNEYDYKPTLCITAILIDKHPEIIQKLNHNKVDLAAHGYIHTNYKSLSEEKINIHIKKAREIFNKNEIPILGIRFPYLSWDDRILKNIKSQGFLWSSNQAICWDVLSKYEVMKEKWMNFQRVIKNLYLETRKSSEYLSLPKISYDFVEIPISLPDDEILIDRLGIKNDREIAQIWLKILEESYQRGELFTLQSHHERVPIFQSALKFLLDEVNSLSGKIWVTSLKEIAEWWKEKNEFNFTISKNENNYYVKTNCSDRATLLVKKPNLGSTSNSLYDNYEAINFREFNIKSEKKPCIGIAEHTPQNLIDFLHEEGFPCEVDSHADDYAVYINNYYTFNSDNEMALLDFIEHSHFPLVRFWRWPNKTRSAFTITGDIDGITLVDFLTRYFTF